jgi:hypothetical protein
MRIRVPTEQQPEVAGTLHHGLLTDLPRKKARRWRTRSLEQLQHLLTDAAR